LELLRRLWSDIPELCLEFWGNLVWVDLNPHLQLSLRDTGAGMQKLAVLNWLFLDCAPLWHEESVLQVDISLTNQVITEEHIVVHSINCEQGASWEDRLKVPVLVEIWSWVINLVILSVADDLCTELDLQVWVRETTNISRSKVVAAHSVETNNLSSWNLQEVLQDNIRLNIGKFLDNLKMIDIERFHTLSHFHTALLSSKLAQVKVKVLDVAVLSEISQANYKLTNQSLFLLEVLSFSLLGLNFNNCLEFTNVLGCVNLARSVSLVLTRDLLPQGSLGTSGLTSLHDVSVER